MMGKKGQCLCGAVKFTATPKSTDVGVCHCGMCRKNNAGPFFALDCGDSLSFESDNSLGIYKSSGWANRTFCKDCGSSIAWSMQDGSMNIVAVDLFDGVEGLKLDHEVYIDHKPSYYSFAEVTQKMTEADIMKMFAEGQSE